MTEQVQPGKIETGEIPSAMPRLIEILTPTEESYPKLIHANLFWDRDPGNKEGIKVKLEYFKDSDGSGSMKDEFIEITKSEFYGRIHPWFERELGRFSTVPFNFGDGETLFQDIQEGLLSINHAPASERRRLTSILVGLAEVQDQFESRDPIDEIDD